MEEGELCLPHPAPFWLCFLVKKDQMLLSTEIYQTLLTAFAAYASPFPRKFFAKPLVR